jgi:hypothetical protein|nr:MAG TPA: hypothetical protein [Caudoviricetes sp.]
MAKKQQNKTDDEVKTDTSENTAETDRTLDKPDDAPKGSDVIHPIAYAVTLRAIHPQASYGRCGYRFNKTDAVYIAVDDLTAEQTLTLAEDPWLELVPVCED